MKPLPDFETLAVGDGAVAAVPERLDEMDTDAPRMDRILALWAAVSCGLAAAGMWAFPAAAPAVVLVKLGAAAGLFATAAGLWGWAVTGRKRARVEIDTRRREIRIHEHDRHGRLVLVRRHDLSEMAEATLCQGRFVARDAHGRLAVSAPVRGRAEQAALRAALSLS